MKKIFSLLLLVLSLCASASLADEPSANAKSISGNPPQHFSPEMINPYGLTQAEMQELALARQEAMKANPDLTKNSDLLRQKMRDFQRRLDQAILQADPNVAPVVTTIERAPGVPLPMHPSAPIGAASTPISAQNH